MAGKKPEVKKIVGKNSEVARHRGKNQNEKKFGTKIPPIKKKYEIKKKKSEEKSIGEKWCKSSGA